LKVRFLHGPLPDESAPRGALSRSRTWSGEDEDQDDDEDERSDTDVHVAPPFAQSVPGRIED
jgi:hypothetical protein